MANERAALVVIDGIEEIEALSSVDILRRADIDVDIISLQDNKTIIGKHNISFQADAVIESMNQDEYDMLIIPGGTTELLNYDSLIQWVQKMQLAQKRIAAICAAPVVLAKADILQGVTATCFPSDELRTMLADSGANVIKAAVITDGNITTSRGPATSIMFALELVRLLNPAKKDVVAESIQWNWLTQNI